MQSPIVICCLSLLLSQSLACTSEEDESRACEWTDSTKNPISPATWTLQKCECESRGKTESIFLYFDLGFDTNETLSISVSGQEIYARRAKTNYQYGRTNDVIEIKRDGRVVVYSGDMFKQTGEARIDFDGDRLIVDCICMAYGPTSMEFSTSTCSGYYVIDMAKRSVVCTQTPQGKYM
jgi:hypothetical protein